MHWSWTIYGSCVPYVIIDLKADSTQVLQINSQEKENQ